MTSCRVMLVVAGLWACGGGQGGRKDSGGSGDVPPVDIAGYDGIAGDAPDGGEVVQPAECQKDEDCTFGFMVSQGKAGVQTCSSDDDCTTAGMSKCWDDLHICGCRDDLECPTQQQCNPETHQCAFPCFTSGECGLGRECRGGFCADQYACNCENKCIAAQCREDPNCGSDKYCDPCYKVCLPKLPACARCDADSQCEGEWSRCVSEFSVAGLITTFPEPVCATWCPLTTGVCVVEGAPQGAYVCANIGDPVNGVCVPAGLDCGQVGKKCESDADCPDPLKQKCWLDRHVCGCRDALSCAFGEACHPITHQCVPGCTSDVECGLGKVCTAGLCHDACSKTPDGIVVGCDDPPPIEGKAWDCDDKGHCYIPGMCFSPLDCREKETYCDTDTHECKPGCLIDYDCKSSAKICDPVGMTCLDKPCEGNYECACGEVCDLKDDPPTCKAAEGNYCAPCDQQQGEKACGDKDTLCIEFQTEDGQSKGSYCMPPCGPDPENPCPQGWECTEIKDDQGKSYGKKCIRFCYHKIEGCAIGNPPEPEPSPETATTADP